MAAELGVHTGGTLKKNPLKRPFQPKYFARGSTHVLLDVLL